MPRLCKLISGILLAVSVGCNTADRDWRHAKDANTASAYTEFLAKHPQSPHVNEAATLLAEFDWKQAKASSTIAAFTEFLAKHPQNSHVGEAKNSLDDLEWAIATAQNTFDGYDSYLAHHTDGKHVADAKSSIKNLPLRMGILSVSVAQKFQAYVGGGANIEPPAPLSFPFGGGGGFPAISISNGSAFLAGEVSSKGPDGRLIRIEVAIKNATKALQSFKIGDISLALAGVRTSDFAAVGYGDQLCAMSEEDRRKVKTIAVQVSPQSTRRLSYVFGITNTESKQGELVLQSAEPVSFEIGRHSNH